MGLPEWGIKLVANFVQGWRLYPSQMRLSEGSKKSHNGLGWKGSYFCLFHLKYILNIPTSTKGPVRKTEQSQRCRDPQLTLFAQLPPLGLPEIKLIMSKSFLFYLFLGKRITQVQKALVGGGP